MMNDDVWWSLEIRVKFPQTFFFSTTLQYSCPHTSTRSKTSPPNPSTACSPQHHIPYPPLFCPPLPAPSIPLISSDNIFLPSQNSSHSTKKCDTSPHHIKHIYHPHITCISSSLLTTLISSAYNKAPHHTSSTPTPIPSLFKSSTIPITKMLYNRGDKGQPPFSTLNLVTHSLP